MAHLQLVKKIQCLNIQNVAYVEAAMRDDFFTLINQCFVCNTMHPVQKPAAKFSPVLDSFFYQGSPISGKPHCGWWWGRQAGKGIAN